ncbi:MAG: export transporter permease LptF [Pseudomonadota bacterium]|jgi:lipopolysaccharide export system permease protein|uniref:Lipopolysaccharide export system permease protein LptF n=1 Tax=Polynucleobacter cosmopolitanus TaxID=351345 RepID=A0A229FWI3_9BURK|nr:LPS export ABC transporter permease LptF [Polynucleobacter cosmopolitanus]OXL16304.1 LPS export ABC transporter permease LptF [Polynucleobacter cosmopolitanus]
MIFKRALRQELNFTTGVVFMVLVTLVLTNLMIRVLGNAASGTANPKDALVLIGLGMINYLPILLTASVFVAILMVLTRWYKDSEMVIWQSAGISLLKILRPILNFTAPIAVAIAVLSIFASPWASEKSATIKQRFQQRDDISMLAPGQFRESSGNNRVFFIESMNPETDVIKNVFVTDFGKERQLVAVAKEGFIQNLTSGEKQLVLETGRRYEGTPGNTDFRITEFDKYTVKLEDKVVDPIINGPRTLPAWVLIQDLNKAHLGEILWRIGLPLMVFVFAIIAIPLSYMDPRRGRYTALIMAVLLYFTYSNLLKLMQAWVSTGKLSFSIGWWLLHVVIALIGLTLIIYRQNRSITLFGRYKKWTLSKSSPKQNGGQ